MSNTSIQIKRSRANAAPSTLNIGELAYSYVSNTLFIGSNTPGPTGAFEIGGERSFKQQTLMFNTLNAAFTRANNTVDANNGGTITGDLTVSGNLVVNGNSEIFFDANIITLNSALPQTSAPSENAGFEVNRGSAANVSLLWNEVQDRWVISNDGTIYQNIGSVTTAFTTLKANGVSVTPQSNSDTLFITGNNGIQITGLDSSNTINIGLTETASGNLGNQIFVSVANGDDTNDGFAISRPFKTVRAAVNAARPGNTVKIAAGIYNEVTPIIVPQRVNIEGDGERSTIIRPTVATNDVFWLNNNCLLTNMGLENYTANGVAFPATNIHSGTAQTGNASSITLASDADSLNNFFDEMQIQIASGTGAGQIKAITNYNGTTKVASVNTNFSTPPDNTSVYQVSIQKRTTPAANTARFTTFINGSPYVFVCSSRTTTGTGMMIDGSLVTGNKSMVTAQFTQVNVGGIGFHVRNDGYAQVVSMYGIFCDIAFLAETGGTASLGNCNVNFGNIGLKANDKGALVMTANISEVTSINSFKMNLDSISVNNDPLFGITANVPYVGIIGFVDGDTTLTPYSVLSSTVPFGTIGGGETIVTLKNSLDNVFAVNTKINFFQQSQLRASGQTFEFVGAGITLTSALPKGGGIPNNDAQVVQTNNGAVFYTSTNERGDFEVGETLVIEQATGTITGRTFSRSLFAELTPFILALEG